MNRRRKILISIGALCITLTPAVLIFQRWASSEAAVTPVTSAAPADSTPTVAAPLLVTSSYFRTILPGGFQIKRQVETATDPHIQLRLVASTASYGDQQFAATRGTLPSDGLRGVADYNLRQTQTAVYAKLMLPDLPAGIEAFRNIQSPAAMTLFWQRNEHYIELAFSTSGGASFDQLQTTCQQVLQNWRWQ